ncbi:MAG: hypothetical protein AB1640_13100 [bacterium]
MKKELPLLLMFLLSCIPVVRPLPLAAEDLDDPLGWDYGEVALGTPSTHSFSLDSLGPTAVWIYVASITPEATPSQVCGEDVSCDFEIASISQPLPLELPTGQSVVVEVTFTPSALGPRQAYLFIQSNDSIEPPGPQAFIPLTGVGTEAPPGWGAAENAEALTASGSVRAGGSLANWLALLLLPTALVVGWRVLRRHSP